MGGAPPILWFFFENLPPIKTDVPPHGVHPHLKMKHPPSEPPPPPTTTTIENLGKICVKKFVFSKFVGLHAYSRQLYYQMNSFTGIFWQHRRAVISESSPLYIKVNREPLVSEHKSLTTKLRVLPHGLVTIALFLFWKREITPPSSKSIKRISNKFKNIQRCRSAILEIRNIPEK